MSVFNTNGYIEEGFSASDNLDISLITSTSGSVNANTAGSYILTYSATDDAGNSASTTRTVRVIVTEEATSGSSGGSSGGGGGGSIPVVEPVPEPVFVQEITNTKPELKVEPEPESDLAPQPPLLELGEGEQEGEVVREPEENVAIAIQPLGQEWRFPWEWLAIIIALAILTFAIYNLRKEE